MERDLVVEMSSRVRKHVRTLVGALVVAMGAAVLLGVVSAVLGGALGRWLVYGIPVALLLIPVAGTHSYFANLRCPACDGRVSRQVAARFSPMMGSREQRSCPHCGKEIFAASS